MYGIMCNEGMGTPKDHQKAASLFSKAAAGGDLKALYNFGVLQIEGRGVKPAQSKGMDAVLRAATGGIPEAQFTVSIWYRDGALGTKQDNKKAYEWAMKAAKQGHTQAQHNVGVQLAEGVGVARNQRQAAEWYNKAVAAGQVVLFIAYVSVFLYVPTLTLNHARTHALTHTKSRARTRARARAHTHTEVW
jgi:TPR repeat protein